MNRPLITISLKPHLADFCRHEFQTTKTDQIILHRKSDIGKYIFSMVLMSDFPVRRPFIEDACTFIIPTTKHEDLKNRFLYVSFWGEQKIQDFLTVEFNRRVKLFFEKGYARNYQQKRIIEAFIAGYNLKNNANTYEAIKKNDYRKRYRTNKIIFKELQSVEL